MIKSIVRAGLLLTIGAGLGIWFAPPNAKGLMRQGMTLAQGKANDFHARVGSKWLNDAGHTLDSAGSVDIKRFNKHEFDRWVKSMQTAYATFSRQAVETQKSVTAISGYLQGAKSEYDKLQNQKFGM